MFVIHVALQGCLRARDVEYGLTADTGGHIRYLLDLVAASRAHAAFDRIEIVTRAFRSAGRPHCYDEKVETIDAATRIVRLRSEAAGYLPKEALWTQHDDMVAALVRHIEGLDRKPDLLHAHYADAGALADEVGARLGIPYLFTGHSLGRVKRETLPPGGDDGLDRRIAIEERAIAGAAAIVASSRDEAEAQYALYDEYEPGRIRIIPPGSDVARFENASVTPAVRASINRFLTDPAKPAILAIARPVTKKNLVALVHAFGRSPELRASTNLVLVAGTRDDIDALEPEIADNLRELLVLIDRYDLYGHVAYPKTHAPADVPAIYAYARETRGVFVNPALNEPFGLTLLEAAAAGLPLVATDSGGPNDIVEACGNGVLVSPRDPDAIGGAILDLLADAERYDRFAAAGGGASRRFDWDAHVGAYATLAAGVVSGRPAPLEKAGVRTLLVSDIDNTLIGCGDALAAFRDWRGRAERTLFAVATGRSFHSALAILVQENAPLPDIVISSVGSEIYHRLPGGTYARDRAWEARVGSGWDRDAIAAVLAERGGLTPQGALEQRRFKLSYLIEGDPGAAARARDLLDAAGLVATIVESHGRYLDILPYAASKGTAVEHVRRMLALPATDVIVAGDSGNDVEMLRSVPNAIIVGNYSDGLAARADLSRCYVARGRYAAGVIEGIEHFRARAAAT